MYGDRSGILPHLKSTTTTDAGSSRCCNSWLFDGSDLSKRDLVERCPRGRPEGVAWRFFSKSWGPGSDSTSTWGIGMDGILQEVGLETLQIAGGFRQRAGFSHSTHEAQPSIGVRSLSRVLITPFRTNLFPRYRFLSVDRR